MGPLNPAMPRGPPAAAHLPRNCGPHFHPVPDIWRNRRLRGPLSQWGKKRAYFNHIGATQLRGRVGHRVWNSYFKFCFEREPWDKTVSWYYFQMSKREQPVDFRDFVMNERLPSHHAQYSIAGSLAVDFVGRYEHLEQDLQSALGQVGITMHVELPRSKGEFRPSDARVEWMF